MSDRYYGSAQWALNRLLTGNGMQCQGCKCKYLIKSMHNRQCTHCQMLVCSFCSRRLIDEDTNDRKGDFDEYDDSEQEAEDG